MQHDRRPNTNTAIHLNGQTIQIQKIGIDQLTGLQNQMMMEVFFSESADRSSKSNEDGNLLSCANMDNNESDILLPDDANRNARTESNGPSTDLIDHDTHVPFPSTNNNNSIMPVERGTSFE